MYAESGQQTDQRDRAFTYHPPGGTQSDRYDRIRRTARNLSELLNHNCPPGRELSLAQSRLQESVMWANAAIACNEVPPASEASSAGPSQGTHPRQFPTLVIRAPDTVRACGR